MHGYILKHAHWNLNAMAYDSAQISFLTLASMFAEGILTNTITHGDSPKISLISLQAEVS
jgi:hypothetical protein